MMNQSHELTHQSIYHVDPRIVVFSIVVFEIELVEMVGRRKQAEPRKITSGNCQLYQSFPDSFFREISFPFFTMAFAANPLSVSAEVLREPTKRTKEFLVDTTDNIYDNESAIKRLEECVHPPMKRIARDFHYSTDKEDLLFNKGQNHGYFPHETLISATLLIAVSIVHTSNYGINVGLLVLWHLVTSLTLNKIGYSSDFIYAMHWQRIGNNWISHQMICERNCIIFMHFI